MCVHGCEVLTVGGALSVHRSLPRIDRLHQTAYDFKHGRPLAQNQDVSHLWDRWRLYIGLISGLQNPVSRKKKAAIRDALSAMAEAPADDDDDEEDEMPNARPPKEANVVVTNDEDVPAQQLPPGQPKPGVTEEQRQQRREYYREVRDTKMDRFLNDPETAVKIFLSGYYRDRGMSFSERFCRDGPILIQFFLNFLIRNRVLPESEKDLRKAVAVTEQAKLELPQSFVISRAIPDDFSEGCEILYGTMTHNNAWQTRRDEEGAESAESEPDAKRQKMETSAETAVLQEAAGSEEIEVVTPDGVRAMEQDAKNVSVDVNREQAAGPAWTWGDDATDGNAAATASGEGNAASQSWGDMNAEWGAPDDPTIWDPTPKTNPLTALLGPTRLPLTHTTGVIERSTRRVKSVTLPAKAAPPLGKKRGTPGDAAEAVERDLEARFAQVALIPWHEWDTYDKADVTKPRILPDSRGPVVEDQTPPASDSAPAVDAQQNVPGWPPHNPFEDEITLLVEPSTAATLLLGTGIEATWVQLARVDPNVPFEADDTETVYGARKTRKGGPGEPVAPSKFWYMEQVLSVLPSFHTEMVPLPTTEEVFGPEEV
ncbi:hypothetical protein C8Q77DRAFT_439030 [Trametes polyzona]|nr:hypothetical protein C8Q77DRAFT_439030 [Trametes polyzona]